MTRTPDYMVDDTNGAQDANPDIELSQSSTLTNGGDDEMSQMTAHVFSQMVPDSHDASDGFGDNTNCNYNNGQEEEENIDYQYAQARCESDDEDSSTLFVPEYSPMPQVLRRQGSAAPFEQEVNEPSQSPTHESRAVPFGQRDDANSQGSTHQATALNMPPPLHPSATPSTPGLSKMDFLRAQAKKLAEKRKLQKEKAANPRPQPQPNNEAYLESIQATIRPPTSTPRPAVDDDEMENRNALDRYQKQKRRYAEFKVKNGGSLNFVQDIEWMKIQREEDARKQKRERDLMYAQMENQNDPELLPARDTGIDENSDEDTDEEMGFDEPGPSSRKRPQGTARTTPKPISMVDAEMQSMLVAIDVDQDKPVKKRKQSSDGDDSQASRPSGRGKGSQAKPGKITKSKKPNKSKAAGKRRTAKEQRIVNHAMRQASSLIGADVFAQQAGANAAEQPGWAHPTRNKQNALKDLISSVPLQDQKQARSDMSTLLAATKKFTGKGSVKPAQNGGSGGWIVKGMKTALKGYQVLGTSFMRERENDVKQPRGGLMADQMGLGKTLMMLANIVNGQPPKGHYPRTTLLVASPSLLTQWSDEIAQHTNCGLRVMRYGAGTRVDSNQPFTILKSHDIVLTTYSEVMRSYPKNEPPIECQTAEQKIAWWREVYDKERGVLHRMMFFRVVLDEAQAIKNHLARTSIACRALIAQHKWALSGTPVLNSLSELYAYFKFLEVPHTGSFKIFKNNYCGTKDSENAERLLCRLAQFMIRRTHADEMFGAPILKLPQANQSTYWCEFNPVERCIYDIVHQRFAKRINAWSQTGELEKSYSNALVMLLRLRQLTAHVLMLQVVMRDLLEREDIERIKEVVNTQVADCNSKQGITIIAVRKQLDQVAAEEKAKHAAEDAERVVNDAHSNNSNNSEDDGDDQGTPEQRVGPEPNRSGGSSGGGSGGPFGKAFDFRPFLRSLRSGQSWETAKKRARCSWCGNQPKSPWITSCGHLLCETPCQELAVLQAAEQGRTNLPCKACGITPETIIPVEADGDDFRDTVAGGTRSKKKQRKTPDPDDIAADWLGTITDDVLPSAKTIAVKAQIMNWTKENPKAKIIIYTQFLAMIRILSRVCQNEGWGVEEYHGKMSFIARDKAIKAFADDPDKRILIASLRCGGLGLNLTMASKVIMIDPWWNSASEQQAFCRIFRIGQNEETSMSRLCVNNTIDQRLVEMQERKQKEIAGVMEADNEWKSKMDIRDLMRLFGNLEEDSSGRPFIMVDNPDRMGGFRAGPDDEGYADEL
ncbi:SNF2 family N-terminal domain-containing protein [Phaeosphaeriaceae sp. PMI808]|nr:SNF2 family N-terminal domain-containing protein [Phaeosphaeriaceae sp. PMI808]